MTIFATVCKLGNVKKSSSSSIGGNSFAQSFGSNGVSCNEACGGNGGYNGGVYTGVNGNIDAGSLLGPVITPENGGKLVSGGSSHKFTPSTCGC